MKSKFFSSLCILGIFFEYFSYSDQAHAGTCEAGKYYTVGGCKSCPSNCYCPTSGDKTYSAFNVWCENTDKDIPKLANWLGTQNTDRSKGWCDIWFCPKDFPYSQEGSKNIESCYARVAGKDVYNKSVKCDPGRYLPLQSNTDVACKNDGRSYCPGGTFHTSLSTDQGIKTCPSGQIPNPTRSGCESSQIKCDPGYYLPSNASSCSKCKTGRYYVCAGGTFTKKTSGNQGLSKCTGGMIAVDNNKRCESPATSTPASSPENTSGINVPAGQYLPANKTTPINCTGSKKYCPGAENLSKSSVDQGIFDCPFNSRTNDSRSGCKIALTKEQMRKGASVASFDCWMLTIPEDYKSCVYGTYFEDEK